MGLMEDAVSVQVTLTELRGGLRAGKCCAFKPQLAGSDERKKT